MPRMINANPDNDIVVPITDSTPPKSEKTIPVPKIKQIQPEKIKFVLRYCMITS